MKAKIILLMSLSDVSKMKHALLNFKHSGKKASVFVEEIRFKNTNDRGTFCRI
jgi:hypothetical protein